jgi:DNA-directed RNA polymerase specialized sigma24 family protein
MLGATINGDSRLIHEFRSEVFVRHRAATVVVDIKQLGGQQIADRMTVTATAVDSKLHNTTLYRW